MSAPRAIRLVGQRFALEFVARDDWRLHQRADLEAVGTILLTTQSIVVARDLAGDQERDTVLHEVLHGLVRIVGLVKDDDEEERIVATLAPILLDALRANPALVRYLTE